MPCEDIIDSLRILLDKNERVVDYSLSRRTCGRGVGKEKLIAGWLRGRPASEVIMVTVHDFQRQTGTDSGVNGYLALKHFLAVQSALAIMLGHASGGPDDPCTLEYIDHSQDGIEIGALLSAGLKAEDIEPCQSCTGSQAPTTGKAGRDIANRS